MSTDASSFYEYIKHFDEAIKTDRLLGMRIFLFSFFFFDFISIPLYFVFCHLQSVFQQNVYYCIYIVCYTLYSYTYIYTK